ncbi:uncharacterized protein LOC115212340 [Argonauta hians]
MQFNPHQMLNMNFMDVPFMYVPIEAKQKLTSLDIPSQGLGNDWKFLAGQIGFSAGQVLSLESKAASHGSNTLKLLEEYSKNASNTVGKLIEALHAINRPREVSYLGEFKEQIFRTYNASKFPGFEFTVCTDDMSVGSQCDYGSKNDDKSSHSDNFYNNYDAITSVSAYGVDSPKPMVYSQKRPIYFSGNCSSYNTGGIDSESDLGKKPVKKYPNIRLLISYADGEKSYKQELLKMSQNLDLIFHCNVDLKNHRLTKQKANDYFNHADFVIVCCNSKYKMTVESWLPLNNEDQPQSLHTKLIYKNMLKQYKSKQNVDHFIPVLFNGSYKSDIPDWLTKNAFFYWPSQKNDLVSYILSKRPFSL